MPRLILLLVLGTLVSGVVLIGLGARPVYEFDGLSPHPAPGYVWAEDSVIPYAVAWQPGQAHPTARKVVAAEARARWEPLPGYRWVGREDADPVDIEALAGRKVVWSPGAAHPRAPHVVADRIVGSWTPEEGYRFLAPGSEDLAVRWVPRAFRQRDHRYVAGQEEGSWDPAPGYMLVAGGTQAEEVRWAPGRVHSFEPCLRAGEGEGTWLPTSREYAFKRLSGGGMALEARKARTDWGGVVLGGIVAAAGTLLGGGEGAAKEIAKRGVKLAVDSADGKEALECDGRTITNKAIFGPYA